MSQVRLHRPTQIQEVKKPEAAKTVVQRVKQSSIALRQPIKPREIDLLELQRARETQQAELKQEQIAKRARSLEIQRRKEFVVQTRVAQQRLQIIQKATARDRRNLENEVVVMRSTVDLQKEYNTKRLVQHQTQNAESLEQSIRRPDVPLQRGKNPTLAGVAEHFITQTTDMKASRIEQAYVLQRCKDAGKTLISYARVQRFPMSELASAIQRFVDHTENTAVRASAFAAISNAPNLNLELQRALAQSDNDLELQRKALQTNTTLESEKQTGISDRIAAQLSGGNPLPQAIQKQLELHFNTDLSKVRVHTDNTAHELAKNVNAIAFTTGNHIFFQNGKFDPDSSAGFELLAHETAHTIQQATGMVSAGIDSSPSLESAAQIEGQKAVANKSILEQKSNTLKDYMGFPKPLEQIGQLSQPVQRKRAIQRDRGAGSVSASQKSTSDGIYVPVDASVDTKKELMVRLLVQLGFDKSLAETHTNANGDFKFENNGRSWTYWRKPNAQEIKAGRMWVGLNQGEAEDLKTKSAQANMRFQAQGGISASNQKASDGFRVIVQERLYRRGEVKGQPALVGEPALKVVPVGTEINYGFDDGEGPQYQSSDYKDPRQFRWFVQNDPKTVKGNIPAVFEGPSKAIWTGEDWDITGDHLVVLEVTSPKEKLRIIFTQRVGKIEDIASQALKSAEAAPDYVPFRAMQEMQSIQLSGGGLLENMREDQRITSTGSNPASGASYISPSNPPPEYTYAIKPTTGAVRFSWRAVPEETKTMATKNYFGYQGEYIDNRLAYIMPGNKPQARFVIAYPNIYNIICNEYDAKNNKIGEATYRQVVLTSEQQAQYDQWQDYVVQGDKAIKTLVAGKEVAIKSVFINQATAVATPINLFIGPNTKGGVTLLDLSPGAPRIEFKGDSAAEALELFDEANKYPKGQIALQIPKNANGIPELERNFKTDGKSTLESWADGIGWASIGLAAAGLVAAIIPGGQVAAGYLFLAAAAAGGVSSSLALADELKQAKPSGVNVAVDILGIASSLIGAGGAVRSLRALAKGGEVALSKAVASKAGQYLIITDFALNGAQGIIIAASSIKQIDDIASSNLSREEKIQRIVRILAGLAINGTLLAFGAKNLGGNSTTRAVTAMNQAERELVNVLPASYRNNTTLKLNPSLEPSVIRVVGDKGSFGVLKNVRIEVGSVKVNQADLLLHLEALDAMRMYANFSGRLRALRDQFTNWVKRNGKPAPMSRAWEIEQEIAKLEKMIATRASALETQKLSKAQKLSIQEEIKVFDKKIAEYKTSLSSKPKAPGTGEIAAPSTGGRVRAPVAGLYDSVDVSVPPKGWNFQDSRINITADGTKTLQTTVTSPTGKNGSFVRSYNPNTQKIELQEAFLNDLPNWIDNTSVSLVAGKGIPTVTYMTMYQMKRLGVDFGGVKTVKMSTIQNFDAILQLETLRRQGIPLNEGVLKTHSVQYADTSIIQSGHEITGAKVITSNQAEFTDIGSYMQFYERRTPTLKAVHDDLLKKYGLSRSDKMWVNYDIELQVKPLASGQVAQPLENIK